jgi:hypothetical protein
MRRALCKVTCVEIYVAVHDGYDSIQCNKKLRVRDNSICTDATMQAGAAAVHVMKAAPLSFSE